ncbi:hypothetical protein COOONC_13885, partial [Cooperia oncophora]
LGEHAFTFSGGEAKLNNATSVSFRDFLLVHNLTQHVVEPTRLSNVLDLILSTKSFRLLGIVIIVVSLVRLLALNLLRYLCIAGLSRLVTSQTCSTTLLSYDGLLCLKRGTVLTINTNYFYHIASCNRPLRPLEARFINDFYKYLNTKIRDRRCFGCLRAGSSFAYTEHDKANMLAEQFAKTFTKDDDTVSSLPNSGVESSCSMGDVPWFLAEELYEQILKWPNSSSVTPDFIPLSFIK